MIAILATSLTFAAVFLAVFAANLLLLDVRQRHRRDIELRVKDELRQRQRERVKSSAAGASLDELAGEVLGDPTRVHADLMTQLNELLIQSGLNLTLTRFVAMCAVSSIGMAVLVLLVWPEPLMMLMVAGIGALLPLLYVHFKRERRLDALRQQLPDGFDLMARILRAGQTVSQAMQSVAEEFDPPIAFEFGYCYEQQNLGIPTEVALRDLARRAGVIEVQIFVMAMMVHRQVGGNLAELLDKLAKIVRERFRIRGLIAALTAEGRLQAIVLLGLPFFLFFALLFINRPYAMKLFEYPTMPAGTVLSMVIGAVWIRKLVNFDF